MQPIYIYIEYWRNSFYCYSVITQQSC